MNGKESKVRVDKWLWAIRFYKTRSLATEACASGKVKIDNDSIKPSRLIKCDEIIHIKKDHINYTIKVLELIEKRVGAPIAAKAYEDLTPEEEKSKFSGKLPSAFMGPLRDRGTGRPTKKERRDLDDFKNH